MSLSSPPVSALGLILSPCFVVVLVVLLVALVLTASLPILISLAVLIVALVVLIIVFLLLVLLPPMLVLALVLILLVLLLLALVLILLILLLLSIRLFLVDLLFLFLWRIGALSFLLRQNTNHPVPVFLNRHTVDHDTMRSCTPGRKGLPSGTLVALTCVPRRVDSDVPIACWDFIEVVFINRDPEPNVSRVEAVSKPSDGNHRYDDADDDGNDCVSSQCVW